MKVRPDEAVISVAPDGQSTWLCEVIWPDGQTVTKALQFALSGYPDIVVTTSDEALKWLERLVRERPGAWRR